MSSTITTSVVTGGTNGHATSVQDVNYPVTDFVNPGVVGTVSVNTGSGGSGSFAVNAQATPAMFVDITAGSAYITATPSGQSEQKLRANMTANYTSYAISSNSSGSTKYDWIYLKVDPTAANNPASDASDVTSLYTSRSSLSTADNGSPPTYGLLLAVVTVANGASSIANSAISDKRTGAALKSVSTTTYFFDFVESGCIWTADSAGTTLNASMTSGFVWISGSRLSVSSVSARAFTASKDTYIDISDNGDGTGAFTYTEVTNNAASPALASGAIRIGIVVAGSSSIASSASINQGQEGATLPVSSSVPYTVTDSLGNRICPRDPERRLLGYKQNVSSYANSNLTAQQVTGLSCPVIVPANRKVRVSLWSGNSSSSNSGTTIIASLWDGTVGSGTQIGEARFYTPTANAGGILYAETILTPSSSSKTYNIGFHNSTSNTGSFYGATTAPAFIKVELI